MAYDPLPTAGKPCLDDLLTTMGITRDQLTGMTAEDLFAAATQWQDSATLAAEAERFASSADHLLGSLHGDRRV